MQLSKATMSLATFKKGVHCTKTLPLARAVRAVQFQHPQW